MRRILTISTLGIALSLGSVLGAAEAWRCDVPTKKVTHFLAGPVIFRVNDDGKSVAVYNPMIMGTFKEPLHVKLSKNTSKVMRAWWFVKKVKTNKGTQIPSLRYSATIQKPSGVFNYHVSSPNYDNSLGITGTCKRIE